MRAYLVGVIVTAGLTGVAWRAYALQIDDGAHYRELAERQHSSSVNIPAPRGDVIDARGRPLAVSADADSIWANPREVRDVAGTAEKLAKLLGEDAGVLEAKLAGDKKFVWLDRHVTREVANAVRAAKLTCRAASKSSSAARRLGRDPKLFATAAIISSGTNSPTTEISTAALPS